MKRPIAAILVTVFVIGAVCGLVAGVARAQPSSGDDAGTGAGRYVLTQGVLLDSSSGRVWQLKDDAWVLMRRVDSPPTD